MKDKTTISPFLKWAGGKTQLLPIIDTLLPPKFNRYFEPFLGGGALLFHLQPMEAVVNDNNHSLIHTYTMIRDNCDGFLKMIYLLDHNIPKDGMSYYNMLRKRYNDKICNDKYDIELSALFVFLNKHCYNGLYRVNKEGLFNVPYNNSTRESVSPRMIREVSNYLKNIIIMRGDFEKACKDVKEGDFVFIDSPYAPLNPSSFKSYTKEGFSVESHKRVANLFHRLSEQHVYCMTTNHHTELIDSLYANKGYDIQIVNVKRLINSDPSKRIGEEVIIRNYK